MERKMEKYTEEQIIAISKRLISELNKPKGKLNIIKKINEIKDNSDFTKAEIKDIFNLQVKKHKENLKRLSEEKNEEEKEQRRIENESNSSA